METNSRIKGKVIVITGASSGIGATTAKLLASQGAQLVLGARRIEQLRKVAESIRKAGGEVSYLQTDVKRPEEVNALVALAQEQFGRLDVLINNAGVAQLALLEEVDVAGWDRND